MVEKDKFIFYKEIISKSGLFDEIYYLSRYRDARLADEAPLEHFIKYGLRENRDPNGDFDSNFYLEQYLDVKRADINPFIHYLLNGKKEGRFTSLSSLLTLKDFKNIDALGEDILNAFSKEFYLKQYPDIKKANINPIEHYFTKGWREGRSPNEWFDTKFYLSQYPDVKRGNFEPLIHYIKIGKKEGRKPNKELKLSKMPYFNYLNSQNQKELYKKSYTPYQENKPINSNIKLIAFYLPQFHPILENDKAWGKGFTEWTNVSKALPQFEGHYQPRLPGELGYYDLRLIEIQKRQIELAKNYGIYGFCYHYYWFNGKKVLEKPLEQLLKHPELDFPFCVNWANENWTKRWDGLDDDVILYQEYSKEDDIEFIKDVSRLFADSRYIKVDGKPLLMIYRPAHFPDIKATAKRWRKWCRENGIGEIFLLMSHSFEHLNPKDIGFDGATEFTPNSFEVKDIKDELAFFNKDYKGNVYSYDYLIKQSLSFKTPPYTKFRSICPDWDNEPRKPGKGTTFYGSTPKKYQEWLKELCRYTQDKFEAKEQFIFINAWNEWGEGAYLEPDQKYGYSYLQATYDALKRCPKKKENRKKIIYVGHDAHFHGAQLLSLNIIKSLKERFNLDVYMILKSGGVLEDRYKEFAKVYNLERDYPTKNQTRDLIKSLINSGAKEAICNTVVTGDIVELLSQYEIEPISLIHELPQLIKNYKMEDNAKLIAKYAKRVIFPSNFVKERFNTIAKVDEKKAVVSPQGLYQKNIYIDNLPLAKERLRRELKLDKDAKIILGAGFADHRKGVDIFVDVALRVSKEFKNAYFVWVGNIEATMQKYLKENFNLSNSNLIFMPQKNDISLYYSGADIYLMTSREDPFPSVVLEAMNAKVPVIGFRNAGGFQDIVTSKTGILVDYEDSLALARATIKLLKDEAKRELLGENSAKLIREKFIWKDYIYRLLEYAGASYKKVSVIVPNYNYEKYIKKRLESIERQTYPIYEVIYLEDCSKDNSLKIAKEFLKKSKLDMKIIENEKNSGSVFKQWYKGITISKGDYIWIAEADDIAKENFLEEVMRGFNNPEVVLSYSQSEQIDENGNLIAKDYLNYTDDIDTKKWLNSYIRDGKDEIRDTLVIKNSIPNVSATVFKRVDIEPILKKMLTFKVAGDWYFYYWLLQRGKIAFTPKALNMHRRHTNSVTISKENNKKHFQEIVAMQELIKKEFDIDEDVWKKAKEYREQVKKYLGVD